MAPLRWPAIVALVGLMILASTVGTVAAVSAAVRVPAGDLLHGVRLKVRFGGTMAYVSGAALKDPATGDYIGPTRFYVPVQTGSRYWLVEIPTVGGYVSYPLDMFWPGGDFVVLQDGTIRPLDSHAGWAAGTVMALTVAGVGAAAAVLAEGRREKFAVVGSVPVAEFLLLTVLLALL